MAGMMIDALERRRLLAFVPIQFGSKGYDSGYEVATDSAGNVIVAGLFAHTVDFGAVKGGASHNKLTAVGDTDIFIAKYDGTGSLIWVEQIGGEESDPKDDLPIDPNRAGSFVNRVGIQPNYYGEYINSVAVDTSGNVFLGGAFFHTADFDPGPGKLELTADEKYGLYDAFLVKLDTNGKLIWADAFGGQFNDVINGVAVDPQGNPVVTGYFTRRADFDPTSKGDFSLDALGRDDIFVAKYTGAGGKLIWVDQFGGEQTQISERDAGNGVALDANGNIYVTGTFGDDKVDFDPGPAQYILKGVKRTDMFLLALSPRGKRVFAESVGGKGFEGGVKIAVQGDRIFTAAYFSGTTDVDPGAKVQELTSTGDDRHTDLLISAFNLDGSLVWAKPMGGEDYETIGGFGVGADGSVYTTGGFASTEDQGADFDPGPGTFFLNSVEGDDDFDDVNDSGRDFSYDIYVSRLSRNGKFLTAKSFGSSGDDFGTGLAIVPSGEVVLAGQFRNTVSFTNTAAGTKKLKSKGVADGVLFELNADIV
jgi:hypothetical protein